MSFIVATGKASLDRRLPASGRTAYVPVTLDLGGHRIARLRVKVQGRQSDIELPLMPGELKSLRFNDLDGVMAEIKSVERG